MSRADRWAAFAVALALGGCMRIYPDPELPDVEAVWAAELECQDDTERVAISLFELDSGAEAGAVTAPCKDAGARIDDVRRVRYRFAAKLEDAAGAELGAQETEIDLRDGLGERVYTYFGRAVDQNVRVRWTFDMGASCASLSATSVTLSFSMAGGGPSFGFDLPCELPVFEGPIPDPGTYTLTAFALALDTVVAASPASAPFAIQPRMLRDLGVVTLSPCGTMCPPPEP